MGEDDPMRRRLVPLFVAGLVLLLAGAAGPIGQTRKSATLSSTRVESSSSESSSSSSSKARVHQALATMPLAFHAGGGTRFVASGPGYHMTVGSDGFLAGTGEG